MDIPYVTEKIKDRIIALDIETTGYSKGDRNRIIQVGVIEYNNGKFVREYSKMFGGGRSTSSCLRVHHITDDMRYGLKPFEDCCKKLSKYLSDSIIVGHNVVSCDMRIINEYMNELGFEIVNYRMIDTYKLAKKVLTIDKYNLENCCKILGIDFGNHDALGDAKSSLMVLDQIIKRRNSFDKDYFFV